MKEEVLLLKLGGSVLTDKTQKQTMHMDLLKRIVSEIAKFQKSSKVKLVVAHGAGSFGHEVAAKYKTKEGFIHQDSLIGMADVARVAQEMNSQIIDEFLAQQVPAVSISPRSIFTTKNGKLDSISIESIEQLLEKGGLPVLFGDVIFDSKVGCTIFSSEKVLQALAVKLSAKYSVKRIIFVTDTDGVYDGKGKTIAEITSRNIQAISGAIGGARGFDVTGGMKHKVDEALQMADQGMSSQIINGMVSENVYKVLMNQEVTGTTIR